MEGRMNDLFEVSVVIPVYNAAAFVTQAVESALAQPEVREVVLVEDCSPDDSLAVCRQLAEKYPQVNLFQHPGGVNRGAGPSRNLGITKSTCLALSLKSTRYEIWGMSFDIGILQVKCFSFFYRIIDKFTCLSLKQSR